MILKYLKNIIINYNNTTNLYNHGTCNDKFFIRKHIEETKDLKRKKLKSHIVKHFNNFKKDYSPCF